MMNAQRTFAPLAAAASLAGACSGEAPPATPASPTYDRAVFRATHNSYSGDVNGARGTITRQLDRGVRFVEFDVHDDDYRAEGYRIGHDLCAESPTGPGCEVDHAGDNPASNRLRDWLLHVAAWSQAHRTHAPLAVALDVKDDLTDNASHADGNLAALNDLLREAFGARLYAPTDLTGAWPTVDALRGRVLAVLSGHNPTRLAYRSDQGAHPAVAMNARGVVVEVSDDTNGALWYWAGRYGDDGTVRWARHGRYDAGNTPAVALNDDGWVVEVHQVAGGRLAYNVGRVDASLDVAFAPAGTAYASGATPTVRFTSAAGLALREVHAGADPSQRMDWRGTLDAATRAVRWDAAAPAPTSDPLFDAARAANGAATVRVSTGADGAAPPLTLRYETDRATARRVRYEELMFVEYQRGDDEETREGARFYAANAAPRDAFAAFRAGEARAGRVFRSWQTTEATVVTPAVNFPASDTPYAAWYDALCRDARCLE